jgi:hypothetical protein
MEFLYHPVAKEIRDDEHEEAEMGEHKWRYGIRQPCPNQPRYPKFPHQDLSSLFKTYRCGEMLKAHEATHGIYDVVIGMRFDIKFLHIQPITLPDPNTIYLPIIDGNQGHADPNGIYWETGYSAHIIWGTSEMMHLCFDMYNWSDDYFKETGIWNTEMMLKWMCDKRNIQVIHTDVTHMLIRGGSENPLSCGAPGHQLPFSETNYPEYIGD